MDNECLYTCGKCHKSWRSSQYDEDDEGDEGSYAQGLKCPNCGEENDISGEVL